MSGKNLLLFSVRDSAMGAFAPVMTFVAMGQAQRSFRDEVNRRESGIYAHPEDFELWALGIYDDESGLFEQQDTVRCVARAKDVGA